MHFAAAACRGLERGSVLLAASSRAHHPGSPISSRHTHTPNAVAGARPEQLAGVDGYGRSTPARAHQAKHQNSGRMGVLLEQQAAGKHRKQHHADDQQPRARVAEVQRIAKAETVLDPDCRVVRVDIEQPRISTRGRV